MRYRSTYRSRGRRSSSGLVDYLMPFLIVIAVGIIVILLFNLWKAIYDSEPEQVAHMYIVEGSAKMKTWGTDDFFDLSSGSILFQGDELQTSANAKIIVEFYDGTIMRVGGDSDLIFEEIRSEEIPFIKVLLVEGKVWVNKVYRDTGRTAMVVAMDNVLINANGASIFDVENEFDETVRILNGDDLLVDVLSEGDKKVVETEKIGLGQEIAFSDEVLSKYWEYQSPTVLSVLSDEFKQSGWYIWNVKEDVRPTDFSSGDVVRPVEAIEGFLEVEPELAEGEVSSSAEPEEEIVDELEDEIVEELAEEEVELSADLTVPTISSVANITTTNSDGFYEVSSRVATLTGSVSGAAQVIVSGYTLQEFKAGNDVWIYHANADYDLMEVGENIYEINSIDAEGKKSETLTVKVLYTPPTPAPVVEEEPVDEEVPVAPED